MYNITAGNDITFRVILYRDNEHFPVELSSEVIVNVVSSKTRRATNFTIDSNGVLTVDVLFEGLGTGHYGIEVTGILNGVRWRSYYDSLWQYTYSTKLGDSESESEGDTYDIVMEVQLYKSQSSDEAIRQHNEDVEAHPYIQSLIPTLPENIVTDENYNHTDNNYTTVEKTKLAGLENYDDTAVRGLIATKQDIIQDLAAIRSGAQAGSTAYQKPNDGIPLADIENTTATAISQGAQAYADVNDIKEKIPSQASAQNQLADKEFVNSSIATNTANYISNNGQPFTSVAQLEAYSGTKTNNDYAFVVGTDATGNTSYTRYKYNAGTQTWAAEYTLNNSSFTAVQWAAINSAITSNDVTKLAALPTAEQLTTLLSGKQDVLTFDNVPAQNSNNPVKSGGVYSALAGKADKVNVVSYRFNAAPVIALNLEDNTIYEVTFVDAIDFLVPVEPRDTSIKNEYCIKFDVGSTVPTLTLPSEIVWAEELELEADTHYVILITYENGAYYGDWKAYPLT